MFGGFGNCADFYLSFYHAFILLLMTTGVFYFLLHVGMEQTSSNETNHAERKSQSVRKWTPIRGNIVIEVFFQFIS